VNSEKQQLILNYLANCPDLFAKCNHIIEPLYFDVQFQRAVKFMKEYYDQYRALPTLTQIKAETGSAFDQVEKLDRHEQQYVENNVEEFCRHSALKTAILSSPELIEAGDLSTLEKNIRNAITVGLHRELGTNFFDTDSWFDRLTDSNTTIPTGWHILDDKLNGGLNRQEMLMFAAASGGGKSLIMANLAKNYCERGYSVVYITLELAEEVVGKRFVSIVGDIPQSEIKSNPQAARKKIQDLGTTMGNLTIKRFPESATTAHHLAAYLKEFELTNGFIPDVFIVDYLDIMATSKKGISAENTFMKEKMISEELRALAHQFNFILVTASQLNRGGLSGGSDNVNVTTLAGGISKLYTCDNVVAIVMDDQMRAKGECIFKLLKTRSSGGVGSIIPMTFNPLSLRVYDKDSGSPIASALNRIAQSKQSTSVNTETPPTPPSRRKIDLLSIIE
jgi:archaellum biogenesis ATPase FlaH